MTIIDAHTHWYPDFISKNPDTWALANGEEHWCAVAGARSDGKRSLQDFPTIREFLVAMDKAQVAQATIQGWYWQNFSNCSVLNSAIARAIEPYSDRLSAYASISPSDKNSAQLLRQAREQNFKGVGEICDAIQNFDFASSMFDDFCQACAEYKFPICVHLSDPRGKDYPNKTKTNNAAAFAAAARNPETKFIFAHFGGGEIFEKNFEALENVFYDCAANTFLYADKAWQNISPALARKMIFGSDYPLRLYPRKFLKAEMSEFLCEAREKFHAEFSELFFNKNYQSLYI